jgi:preprotein translocase subunit SecA
MNEQRKVIYARRMQILEGEDLRARTVEVLSSALDSIVTAHCTSDYAEDWNVDGLLTEARLYFPTTTDADTLRECEGADDVYELLAAEGIAYYEQREEEMPGGAETMRALEREVMLQLIDQKWREHLSEMDYLREGIGLRAMGQQDPLVAWQREGYEMFGQLVSGIDDDYVKIVMHAQVHVLEQTPTTEEEDLAGATYAGPEDPVGGDDAIRRAMAAGPAPGEEVVFAPDPTAGHVTNGDEQLPPAPVLAPVVKDEVWDRVGRNDACPCGSGKKFKFCHGR